MSTTKRSRFDAGQNTRRSIAIWADDVEGADRQSRRLRGSLVVECYIQTRPGACAEMITP